MNYQPISPDQINRHESDNNNRSMSNSILPLNNREGIQLPNVETVQELLEAIRDLEKPGNLND